MLVLIPLLLLFMVLLPGAPLLPPMWTTLKRRKGRKNSPWLFRPLGDARLNAVALFLRVWWSLVPFFWFISLRGCGGDGEDRSSSFLVPVSPSFLPPSFIPSFTWSCFLCSSNKYRKKESGQSRTGERQAEKGYQVTVPLVVSRGQLVAGLVVFLVSTLVKR